MIVTHPLNMAHGHFFDASIIQEGEGFPPEVVISLIIY